MSAAERGLFRVVREQWRMEHVPGLEVLARIQHHGGPTRLLDVTRNPLIALWFAVQPSEEQDSVDARVFAIATRQPLPKTCAVPPPVFDYRQIVTEHDPFWFEYESLSDCVGRDWGTGSHHRIWIPPAYDERISAQNAAFLLEGLPIPSASLLEDISRTRRGDPWSWADLAAASCIYFLPADSTQKVPQDSALAPVFSFRVPVPAKQKIYRELARLYVLLPGTVYPDVEGLSAFLRQDMSWISANSP